MSSIFSEQLLAAAASVLAAARQSKLRLATAETVTGGLVAACLTSVSGASEVFERGFVLYHSSAKASGLGIDAEISSRHGAVSAEVTKGLAEGALTHSTAGAAVAVTGYAGPGGGSTANPVGTVYVAAARSGGPTLEERHVFPGSRDEVRLAAVGAAIRLLKSALDGN
ncbi:MAG TPA: CinA family protein [Stellaceae bacterium]|nr:CinA family protein [Stellaceae bacterium]